MSKPTTKKASKVPYRCPFCKVQLKPLPLRGTAYLMFPVGLRPYHCPHCFMFKIRPWVIIGRIFLFWR